MKSITEVVQNLLKPYIDGNGSIILIAASYGVTPSESDNCMVYLEDLLDGVYDNIYKSAESGASFSNGQYLSQLQTLASSITNKDAVKDIVVIGHGNDVGASASDLVTAMTAFNTYARTTFPHAKVSLAPVSVLGTPAGASQRFTTYNIIMNNMYQHHISVMTDLFHILALDYETYTGSDKWHPSSAGAKLIADGIYNVLVHGGFNKYVTRSSPVSEKTIGSYMNIDSVAFYQDDVSTDINEMAVSIVLTFTATMDLVISQSWLGTRFMTCNPMIKGITGDYGAARRIITGYMTDKTGGGYIPIRIAIHPHSNERPNEYWYYISTATGADYQLESGHVYSVRVTDRTPFLYN